MLPEHAEAAQYKIGLLAGHFAGARGRVPESSASMPAVWRKQTHCIPVSTMTDQRGASPARGRG